MPYLFFFLIVVLLSCNNAAKPPLLTEDSAEPDGTELNDTNLRVPQDTIQTTHTSSNTALGDTPTEKPTKLPQGFYKVVLPCEDCPRIEQTVFFQANKSFLMEEVSPEHPDSVVKTSGQFNPSAGTIWAYKGQIVKARYTWGGDTLYYLQPNGKRLAMQKLTAATENEVWRKKGKEGLAFYAVGNEPFWNLEINRQHQLAFHQAEWSKPLQLNNMTVTNSDDSMVYTATSDSATVKAVVYPRFCSDGMSDFHYTHTIRVVYNGKTYKGCGIMY